MKYWLISFGEVLKWTNNIVSSGLWSSPFLIVSVLHSWPFVDQRAGSLLANEMENESKLPATIQQAGLFNILNTAFSYVWWSWEQDLAMMAWQSRALVLPIYFIYSAQIIMMSHCRLWILSIFLLSLICKYSQTSLSGTT